MLNSLYPGFVRIEYVAGGHPHTQTLPVKPFQVVGGGWGLEKPIAPAQYASWSDGITAWVTIVRTLFHTSTNFVTASLWTLAAPESDPQFRDEVSLGIAGMSSSTTSANSQLSVGFRTDAGGILKLMFMESAVTVNQVGVPAAYTGLAAPGAASMVAIAAFLKGNENCFYGRDGGRPIASLRAFTKTNDALRKKFVLDA